MSVEQLYFEIAKIDTFKWFSYIIYHQVFHFIYKRHQTRTAVNSFWKHFFISEKIKKRFVSKKTICFQFYTNIHHNQWFLVKPNSYKFHNANDKTMNIFYLKNPITNCLLQSTLLNKQKFHRRFLLAYSRYVEIRSTFLNLFFSKVDCILQSEHFFQILSQEQHIDCCW